MDEIATGPSSGALEPRTRLMGFVRNLSANHGPGLARQPRDRGVVHGHDLGNGSAAFAGGQALEGLGLASPAFGIELIGVADALLTLLPAVVSSSSALGCLLRSAGHEPA
jgi:hypothetical protein